MKRLILLLVLAASPLLAETKGVSYIPREKEPSGFQDIKFGATLEEARAYLAEKYKMGVSPATPYSEKVLVADNDLELHINDDVLFFVNFPLGDKKVRVFLSFNKLGHFYQYTIMGPNYSANYFDTDLQEDVRYLSKVFAERFGPPSSKFTPKYGGMREGYAAYYWKWSSRKCDIATDLNVHESEYFASASVTNRALEKEHAKAADVEEKNSVKKAAQEF